MVCPTSPGNLEPASGKNRISKIDFGRSVGSSGDGLWDADRISTRSGAESRSRPSASRRRWRCTENPQKRAFFPALEICESCDRSHVAIPAATAWVRAHKLWNRLGSYRESRLMAPTFLWVRRVFALLMVALLAWVLATGLDSVERADAVSLRFGLAVVLGLGGDQFFSRLIHVSRACGVAMTDSGVSLSDRMGIRYGFLRVFGRLYEICPRERAYSILRKKTFGT